MKGLKVMFEIYSNDRSMDVKIRRSFHRSKAGGREKEEDPTKSNNQTSTTSCEPSWVGEKEKKKTRR